MIELELIQRALNAWDATPLPKASDGLMQEVMEDLRAALAPAGTVADWYAAGMDYAYTEATDPSSGDEWATQDVAKAFAAGARLALRAAPEAPADRKAALVHELVNAGDFAGMSEAFDRHIGCAAWADPAWRSEVSTWAAAWRSALAAPKPSNGWLDTDAERAAPVAPVDHDEFALFRNDLCDFLRHVIDMGKGDHYWDVVRGNAGALLRRVDRVAPVAPADGWEHLKVYGYAPGDYMSRCHKCGLIPAGLDKRATTCRPCAEAMHAAAPAELPTTRSQRMRDAGFTRRPTWHSLPGDDAPTPVAPVGMAYVPLVMTQAMRDATDSEGWTWEDLLAAAEAITEDEYTELAATVAPAEPITVEAVAEVRDTDDGLTIDWLIEGGIDAMVPGCVLVCATRPITDDKGQGEVYLAPVAPADYPECSSDPTCCPENEGFGCCKSAAPATPALVPLTDEQLLRVAGSTAYLHAYDALRAVEAAHGIKP